jgi:iron complex transport system ATP-binding protein
MTILESKELKIGYGSGLNVKTVADGLNFSLEKGSLACILGPNGVGKSTLIKTIMGQMPALAGEVFLDGKSINTYSQQELAKKIAVVLTDKVRSGNLSVYQLVSLGRIPHTGWLGSLSQRDQDAVEKAITATQIDYIRALPITEISDGQLQKVMIARALAQESDLIILDEPTAHLDLINRIEIMEMLRGLAKIENKAVLVVTHDLEIAIQTADIFWLMQCVSPLVAGSPEDLILDGQINLLFPSEKFHFDTRFGKVVSKGLTEMPNIFAPEDWKNWIQLAWKKHLGGRHITEGEVHVQANPTKIVWKQQELSKEFSSISALMEYLKWTYRPDKHLH